MIEIKSQPQIRKVKHTTFHLAYGELVEVHVSESLGDSIDWDSYKEAIIITLAERPSTDISFYRPAETLTIWRDKILWTSTYETEEMDRTPEQEELFRKTIQEMASKSVN